MPTPFADPAAAERKVIELANAFTFIYELKRLASRVQAGLDLAVANGWLEMHESAAPSSE